MIFGAVRGADGGATTARSKNRNTMQPSKAVATERAKIAHDMSAAFDFPRTKCRLKYLICSIPRSGSWLLCDGLASTGQAGRPAEYLTRPYTQAYRARVGIPRVDRVDYWRFLIRHRTSPNGVFGMKLHYEHVAARFPEKEAQREFLARFDRFIFLWRRDKLAQAVSAWKARRTEIFRVAADESLDLARASFELYDFHGIAERLGMIADQEAGWRAVLGELADKTFSLTYEELSTRYVPSVQSVLVALGLDAAAGAVSARPQVLAQRDETNRQWEERFLNDLHSGAARREVTGALTGFSPDAHAEPASMLRSTSA
jgi:LPS sulfotransferase NodH